MDGLCRRLGRDRLAELAKACDDHARPAEADDTSAAFPPGSSPRPGRPTEAAEVLRVAAQHDLYVVARGAGTKLDWGGARRAVDLIVDTARLDRRRRARCR